MLEVEPRAHSREDRSGDPLDGLVNLFDLGIVLAVAFLLATLASLKLEDLLTSKDVTLVRSTPQGEEVIIKENERVRTVELDSRQRVVGQGSRIGSVFRLGDGRTVFVPSP
jgi:hypothetical protein